MAFLMKSKRSSRLNSAMSLTCTDVLRASDRAATSRSSPTKTSSLTNLSMSDGMASRRSMIALYVWPPSRMP